MKRILLLFAFSAVFITAKAADTLTTRQIYNYDVGDSFAYVSADYDATSHAFHQYFSTAVILAKWYSISQDSLFYVQTGNDTLLYTGLDQKLSLIDTPQNCQCTLHFTIDSTCNTIRNSLTYEYIKGLGKAFDGAASDDGSYSYTALTYSVKAGLYQRTPYFTTSMIDVSDIPDIHLYPNPTAGSIHLSFPDASRNNGRLILIDILGQEVSSSSIADTETTHDISSLPSGIYTWRVVSDNTILKTGKIVKQ
jgi:hypothetical protein